jgi:hypothetical protein
MAEPSRCLQAARVCTSILSSLISHHRAVYRHRMALTRSFKSQSLDGGRDAVRALAVINIQASAYRKVIADVHVLDAWAASGKRKASELSSGVSLSLQRLRSVAKAANSPKGLDLQRELDKFPTLEDALSVTLTHDYFVLLAGADPTPEELGQQLPLLGRQANVPVDWLERVTGVAAVTELFAAGANPASS